MTIYINKVIKARLWLLALLALGLAACSEDDGGGEDEFADWQARNETYFSNIYRQAQSYVAQGNNNWKILTKWSVNEDVATASDRLVVQVLNEGTGSGCPLYTDSVEINYNARLIPSASYPSGYTFYGNYAGNYNPKLLTPSRISLSATQLGDGFATALMNMHIGDRWTVYIPYPMAPSAVLTTASTYTLPTYSMVVVDVELMGYYR